MTYEVIETEHCRVEITTNWDELTPERQQELRRIYAKHMVDSFFRQEAKKKLAEGRSA